MLAKIRVNADALPRLGTILEPSRNSFSFLRLVMASLVLISHTYLFTFGTSSLEPLTAWTGHSLGEHAVQVFFFLSGLMVAQSFERSRGIADFASARVLRIFPALFVCVLLTALALGPIVSRVSLSEYLSSAALPLYVLKTLSLSTGSAPLPGVFETLPLPNLVNMSLWTLKYEVLCYAGLAAAGAAGLFNARWRWPAAALMAVFIATIYAINPKPSETFNGFDNLRYFSVFFGTGVLAYLARDRLIIMAWALLPLFALFAATLGTDYSEPATALLLGYGTLWAATKTYGPFRAFCNRFDLSFGVYIYAGPIQQALIQSIPGAQPVAIILLTFAAVLPLGFLSWVLIEKPALGLRGWLATSIGRARRPDGNAAIERRATGALPRLAVH